jgi:hypothetical protein
LKAKYMAYELLSDLPGVGNQISSYISKCTFPFL